MKLSALVLLTLAPLALIPRREREIPILPRHLDPDICHAPWCATTRTGRPDDCDCGTDWRALDHALTVAPRIPGLR